MHVVGKEHVPLVQNTHGKQLANRLAGDAGSARKH
jgi:hypothetical protein